MEQKRFRCRHPAGKVAAVTSAESRWFQCQRCGAWWPPRTDWRPRATRPTAGRQQHA